MEIPNRVYLEILSESDPKEVCKNMIKFKRTLEDDIEYTRTDAFIEKACEWLDRVRLDYYNENRDEFITNFKKHMKGE